MSVHNSLWVEKYRPNSLSECILTEELEKIFLSYWEIASTGGEIPNLIFTGPPGTGKTSVAIALLKNLDCDYIKVNASLEKGIDLVRDRIKEFASTCSFKGDKRKFIILDEADGLLNSAQEALRGFFEEYSINCGFILTCNNETKLSSALDSRCKLIDFSITKKDFVYLARKFYEKLEHIFQQENVTYNKQCVAFLMKKSYPDWRKILVELQHYCIINNNVIDTGVLANKKEENYIDLIDLLKNKRWTDMRKWIGENYYGDFISFSRKLQKGLEPVIEIASWPTLTILINEYDYRSSFCVDKEINTVAFLSNIMTDIIFLK